MKFIAKLKVAAAFAPPSDPETEKRKDESDDGIPKVEVTAALWK